MCEQLYFFDVLKTLKQLSTAETICFRVYYFSFISCCVSRLTLNRPKQFTGGSWATGQEANELPLFVHGVRRQRSATTFFVKIGCYTYILPPKRDSSVSLRLRRSTVYPITQVRTKLYCSFVNYYLKCYQWQPYMFVIATIYFILCLYVVHIGFSCYSQELYLYPSVVFYIVFLYHISISL